MEPKNISNTHYFLILFSLHKRCMGYILLGMMFLWISDAQAQEWRFPDCNDLSITSIEFSDNRSMVNISVHNSCDTCIHHVYTGLIVFRGKDTLALDQDLHTRQSPDNNKEETYTLDVWESFITSDPIRVSALNLCDSIPVSSQLLLAAEQQHEQKQMFYPNPVWEELSFYKIPKNVVLTDLMGKKVAS